MTIVVMPLMPIPTMVDLVTKKKKIKIVDSFSEEGELDSSSKEETIEEA